MGHSGRENGVSKASETENDKGTRTQKTIETMFVVQVGSTIYTRVLSKIHKI